MLGVYFPRLLPSRKWEATVVTDLRLHQIQTLTADLRFKMGLLSFAIAIADGAATTKITRHRRSFENATRKLVETTFRHRGFSRYADKRDRAEVSNEKKVPSLFLTSGAEHFTDPHAEKGSHRSRLRR